MVAHGPPCLHNLGGNAGIRGQKHQSSCVNDAGLGCARASSPPTSHSCQAGTKFAAVLEPFPSCAENTHFLSRAPSSVQPLALSAVNTAHCLQLAPLLPAPDAPQPSAADRWLDVYSANTLTRTGGRAGGAKLPPRALVVDVREFMARLPAVLHAQGFQLTPVTLEVGHEWFERWQQNRMGLCIGFDGQHTRVAASGVVACISVNVLCSSARVLHVLEL